MASRSEGLPIVCEYAARGDNAHLRRETAIEPSAVNIPEDRYGDSIEGAYQISRVSAADLKLMTTPYSAPPAKDESSLSAGEYWAAHPELAALSLNDLDDLYLVERTLERIRRYFEPRSWLSLLCTNPLDIWGIVHTKVSR
jgi:hypothetical protein